MSEYIITAKCERCGNTESQSVEIELYGNEEARNKEMLAAVLSAFRIRISFGNKHTLLCSDCESEYRRLRDVCSAIHDRMIENFWKPKGGE